MASIQQKREQNVRLLQHLPAGWFTVLAAACVPEIDAVYDPAGSTVLSEVLHSFRGLPAVCAVLIPLAALFYLCTEEICGRRSRGIPEWILAFLYSACMLLGLSYERTGSWALIRGGGLVQGIKAVVMLTGGTFFFRSIIRWAELLLDRACVRVSRRERRQWKCTPGGFLHRLRDRYMENLCRVPFRTAFLTLFVLYIPYVLISWPVTLMGDADAILTQGFPEAGVILPVYMRGHLLSDEVFLNAHHPVAHTLLVHIFLRAGMALTGNANISISLYAVFQLICMLAVIAWTIREAAVCMGVTGSGLAGMLLFYSFLPVVRNYMFLLSKDVFYSAFLMLFLCSLIRVITDGRRSTGAAGKGRRFREACMTLLCSALGMLLFRNEARYVLLLAALLAAAIHTGLRKKALVLAGFVLAAGLLYNNVMLPACHITGGSIREMLSVPVQQTARYMREYPGEVTAEQEKAIRAVLNYDDLAQLYDPDLSDPVKNSWNEDADREDLKNYMRAWLQMFRRRPGVYVQAFLNNYYLYLYPGSRPMELYRYSGSEKLFELVNGYLAPAGIRFSYPEALTQIRYRTDTLRKTVSECPPANLLMNTAVYVWGVLFLLFYALRRRRREAMVLLAVPFVMLLVLAAGPCNGNYSRYIYPIVMSMPVLISGVIYLCRHSAGTE